MNRSYVIIKAKAYKKVLTLYFQVWMKAYMKASQLAFDTLQHIRYMKAQFERDYNPPH